jgi:hypothetical protein
MVQRLPAGMAVSLFELHVKFRRGDDWRVISSFSDSVPEIFVILRVRFRVVHLSRRSDKSEGQAQSGASDRSGLSSNPLRS